MLLRDLTIENFRSFEKYQLNGLARVNLLVGDNNCGKTSVLEAVHFVVSRGAFGCLMETFSHRGCSSLVDMSAHKLTIDFDEIASLFFRSNSTTSVDKVRTIVLGVDNEASFRLQLKFNDDFTPHQLTSEVQVGSEIVRRESMNLPRPLFPGQKSVNPTPVLERQTSHVLAHSPAHFVVPTRGVTIERLSGQWDRLFSQDLEKYAEVAIKIIDPTFSKVHFVQNAKTTSKVIVDRGGLRVRLSELGDGVRAALSIGIALGSTRGGTLLVDEIDTGLHYSRLPDMWRMVIKAAQELDVQVFATTHSLDCIRGLDEAILDDEALASEVAIFSIDRRMKEAVKYEGHELSVIVNQRIEVR